MAKMRVKCSENARIVQDVGEGSVVGVMAGCEAAPGAGLLAEAGAGAGACVGVWQSDASHRPF